MTTEIVLIGPGCSGKSTIGWLLSESLGLPQVPLDSIKYDLFIEIGYDEAYAKELYKPKDSRSCISTGVRLMCTA